MHLSLHDLPHLQQLDRDRKNLFLLNGSVKYHVSFLRLAVHIGIITGLLAFDWNSNRKWLILGGAAAKIAFDLCVVTNIPIMGTLAMFYFSHRGVLRRITDNIKLSQSYLPLPPKSNNEDEENQERSLYAVSGVSSSVSSEEDQ